jgi:hypothetical protein
MSELAGDSWSDVGEFAAWWRAAGMPICPPAGAEVFLTDDATAFCLFRKEQFQVELYLIHPGPALDIHEHPGLDVIQMQLTGEFGHMSPLLRSGQSHGEGLAKTGAACGMPLITFEHWLSASPSTAAACWRGPTVGPKQEALIRRFYPTAYIERGYADITKPANYRELLAKGKE